MAAATQTPRYRGDLYGRTLAEYIYQRSQDLGIDPYIPLSVVPHEGGFQGAVGDHGSSFGPFQLHRGGALPSGLSDAQAVQWANSPAGIDYALTAIRDVIRSHGTDPNRDARPAVGTAGVAYVVREFEHPLKSLEQAEVNASSQTYLRLSRVDSGTAADFWSGKGGSAAIGGILGIIAAGAGAVAGGAGGGAAIARARKGAGSTASSVARGVGSSGAAQTALGAGIVAGIFSALGVGPVQLAEILAGAVLFLVGLLVLGRTVTR